MKTAYLIATIDCSRGYPHSPVTRVRMYSEKCPSLCGYPFVIASATGETYPKAKSNLIAGLTMGGATLFPMSDNEEVIELD